MASRYTIGAGIALEGEEQFRSAVKSISSELSLLKTEMNKVSAEYADNDDSLEALTAKQKVAAEQVAYSEEKVKVLKAALEDVKNTYGENSDKVVEWQKKLNNAETELSKSQKALNSLNSAIDEEKDALKEQQTALTATTTSVDKYSDALSETESSAISFSDIVKANFTADLLSKGFDAAVSAVKKLGEALVDVGKQAVENYAEYEQLVGGVETLFGDSSDTVIEYANNAFATAGISANDYMETVTSFAASLVSSLDGDTEEAAEIANTAISDMADNANKMGTDMTSIQNAYQGFAKQNYTMLDNLKLGYGGTKTEMERLLADAEELSGMEFNIDSFSDVAQAIHVIQEEMGITGTTAKEAATTIQGSMSSVQAAWQNLLTGVADDTADFDTLIDNFIQSAEAMLSNMLPRVEQTIVGLGDMIKELLPTVIEEAETIIGDVAPELIEAATEAVNTIATSLAENSGTLAQMGIDLVLDLAEGIAEALPTLGTAAGEIIGELVGELLNPENLARILAVAAELVASLVGGIVNALTGAVSGLWDGLTDGFDSVENKSAETAKKLLEDIEEIESGLQELQDEYSTTKDRIEELYDLKNSGDITAAEEIELQLLESQNRLLENQIELENLKLQAEKDAAEQAAIAALQEDENTKGSIANIESLIEQYNALNDTDNELVQNITRYSAEVEDAYEIMSDASGKYTEDEKAQAETDYWNKKEILEQFTAIRDQSLAEIEENINESVALMNQETEALQYESDESIEMANQVSAALNDVSVALYGTQLQIEETMSAAQTALDWDNSAAAERQKERAEEEAKALQESFSKEVEAYETSLSNYQTAQKNKLSLQRITEDEYYANLKSYLENHVNTNSEAYYTALSTVETYYTKKQETADKAAATALKEQESAAKTAQTAQEKADKEALTAAKKLYDNLLKEYKAGTKTKAQYDEEYNKLLKDNLNVQTDLAEYAQEKMTAYAEEQAEERQKTLESELTTITNEYTKTLDSLQSKIDSFASKLTNSYKDSLVWTTKGDVYDEQVEAYEANITSLQEKVDKWTEIYGEDAAVTIQWQKQLTAAQEELEKYKSDHDSSTDSDIVDVKATDKIKTATKELEEYNKLIEDLKARGIDDSMLQELSGMTTEEGKKLAEYWDGLSDKELTALSNNWKKYNEQAQELSKSLYQSEIDSTTDAYIDGITAKLKDCESDMQQIGIETVEALLEAYNPETATGAKSLEDLKKNITALYGGTTETTTKTAKESGTTAGEAYTTALTESVAGSSETVLTAVKKVFDDAQSELNKAQLTFTVVGNVLSGGTSSQSSESSANSGTTYNFTQNISSPKAVSAADAYKGTKQQIQLARVMR